MLTTQNAIIYTRISQDKTGEELGVTRQLEDCQSLAERRGWHVSGVYTDNDISAKGTRKRPSFEAILEEAASGRVQVIVAWNFDRLTRNRKDTVRLLEVCQERSITIALARGTDLDMSNPGGRLMAGILAEVARNEIDVKSDRQIASYRQAAKAGKPHYVARPFGYTRSGELVEDEALVLKQIAEHYLNGWSTTELTKWLNDSGIKAATGGLWSRRVVKDHLLAKRNAGIRVYKGQEYKGNWVPVYDLATHEALVGEWEQRKQKRSRGSAPRRYLLTGLLVCGRCGSKMAGHAHSDRQGQEVRDKYACTECSLMRVAVTLDHFIKELVLYRLDSDELRATLAARDANTEQIEPLRLEARAVQRRIDALVDDYADGTLSKSELVRAKERQQEALHDIEQRMSQLYASRQSQALLGTSTGLRQSWNTHPVGWRRQLLSLVIERIEVEQSYKRPRYVIDGKGYKFDPDAVTVVWKA
jgi:site-specific DNA recombinase